jgi:hypothetical protein
MTVKTRADLGAFFGAQAYRCVLAAVSPLRFAESR